MQLFQWNARHDRMIVIWRQEFSDQARITDCVDAITVTEKTTDLLVSCVFLRFITVLRFLFTSNLLCNFIFLLCLLFMFLPQSVSYTHLTLPTTPYV